MKMNSLCKVAMIEPVGGHGGMDYYDFGLCEGLSDAGCDVVLYTCEKTILPKGVGFSIKHTYQNIYGNAPVWRRGIQYMLGSIHSIIDAVFAGRKVCHFHFFHVGVMEAFNIALAKLFARSVVVTAHDVESFVDSLTVPKLALWVYQKADRVIAHNQISKLELIKKLNVSEEKIVIIEHGNYLHMLHPLLNQQEACETLDIPKLQKTILFFGQIKEVKGLDLLLSAIPDLLKEHPDSQLLIAGKTWKSDFSKYEVQINKLGISAHCFSHIRYIPDEDVPLYYSAADIVVLPYRRIYQSGVVLMTMSYGKAVLVSNLPGMTEIVREGENGYVFQQGDKRDLVQQLCRALDDSDERQRMAENGFKYVRDLHSWRTISLLTLAMYEDVLPRNQAKKGLFK